MCIFKKKKYTHPTVNTQYYSGYNNKSPRNYLCGVGRIKAGKCKLSKCKCYTKNTGITEHTCIPYVILLAWLSRFSCAELRFPGTCPSSVRWNLMNVLRNTTKSELGGRQSIVMYNAVRNVPVRRARTGSWKCKQMRAQLIDNAIWHSDVLSLFRCLVMTFCSCLTAFTKRKWLWI